jgi:hypothetical protein
MVLVKRFINFISLENILKTKIIICIIFAFVLLGIGLPAFGNAVSVLTLKRDLSGLFNWWIFAKWSKELGITLFWGLSIMLWTFINSGELYPKMIEQDAKLLNAILTAIGRNPKLTIGIDEDPKAAEVKKALNKRPGFSLGSAKWLSRICIFWDAVIAVTATPLTKNAEQWELLSWTGDPQYLEIANFFLLIVLVMGMSVNFYFFSKYVEDLRECQKIYSGGSSRSNPSP